jgi:ATP-dependent helicase/nuclease subunit A
VQNILDGHYSAAPSHANCSYCAYAEICEKNYRETGNKELSLVEMETQMQHGDSITQLTNYFSQAAEQYYRLIIVPYQNTSSINFRQIAETTNSGYINVNLELSRCLLVLTQRQRALKAEELLKKIVSDNDNHDVFYIEKRLFFNPSSSRG